MKILKISRVAFFGIMIAKLSCLAQTEEYKLMLKRLYSPTQTPLEHYLKHRGVPEHMGNRLLKEEETFLEEFDANGDEIPDVFISNVYAINGKAGYIWSPYLSLPDEKFRLTSALTFRKLNTGTFVDENGAIISCWPGSAEEGSFQIHKWTGEKWNVETVARYKRNEDFKTVLTMSSGDSYIVAEDGLYDKMKEIFLQKAEGVAVDIEPSIQPVILDQNAATKSEKDSVLTNFIPSTIAEVPVTEMSSTGTTPLQSLDEKNGSGLLKFVISGLLIIGGGVVFGYKSRRKRVKKKGQNTSFSQPLFLRTEFGMAVGSPLMSGFLRLDILRDLGFGFGMDSNDWKQVVAFRALVTRPLQTGLTRHRFPERGVSEYL